MFRGMGLYKYDGPGSVSILTMDRLTDDSFLNVPPTSTLRKIIIQNGNTETCDLVKAPHHISVYVNGKMCVSTCNSVKPNLRTHPPLGVRNVFILLEKDLNYVVFHEILSLVHLLHIHSLFQSI